MIHTLCMRATMLLAVLAMGTAAHGDDGRYLESEVPIRGVVRAVDQAALSTDLSARITQIGFRIGETFKAGDLLVSFDCDRYRSEAKAAEAVWKEMRLALESNQTLDKFRAVGRNDLEISRARVAKAEAEAEVLNTRVSQCEIRAPFNGRVAELTVNAHEHPQPGKPFLMLVGEGRLEIDLIVPSTWLAWLRAGALFRFELDETGRSYEAQIVWIGAAVDAVSQMVKVIAAFKAEPEDVLSGMSGVATFQRQDG
jgi:membrane fusion protein, multidrug efflux system